MSITRAVIIATGSYLPSNIVTNDDLAKRVDTSDEWITQRSGIRKRHVAGEGETTTDLAINAARMALTSANIDPLSIDGIIVATTTPDQAFPSVAVKVQAALGCPPRMAFDLQAVCAGFVYALSTASHFIAAKQAKRILVIGAETMSRLLDWNDRTTCVLFGDGAGAVILEAQEGAGSITDRGILSTHLHADGRFAQILQTNAHDKIEMQGKDVFKHAVNHMVEIVDEVLTHNNITADQIDWLIPHQANSRIIQATAEKLNMSMDRVVMTVSDHANTSAASVPLALDAAARSGKLQKGQLILFEALGAGLSWGAVLARY
jgi:3-oxoacyl-[acyl-carrier-protein] synthase III